MSNQQPSDPADLRNIAQRVDAELTRFVDLRAVELAALHPELAQLTVVLRPLLAGGKRMRPAFAYWGYRAGGGDDSPEVIRAVAALEFVQLAALIHDDLIDGSESRRGLPAAHVAFAANTTDPKRGNQFGAGAAILLGDLCLSWADQLFYESGVAAGKLAAAKPFYDAMRTEVTGGQFLDLLVQLRRSTSLDDALQVTALKTAKYTIERPLHIGAALAGADASLIAGLSRFGQPLGIAFQLRDDLLGVFGDPAVTGKPAGDDLREGKRTALVALAVQQAPADVRAEFELLLGDRQISATQLKWLVDQIRDSGAIAEVERMIDQQLAEAMQALGELRIDSNAAAALESLAVAAAARDK